MFAPAVSPAASRAKLWRAEAKAMLALGVPLALSQLGQIAIHTTDVVMLGWLSPAALAASGLAANLFFVLFLFGLGVVSAVSPIVSQILGRPSPRGKLRDVRRAVRQGFWVATMLALPFMAVCWQVRPILTLFGQDPSLIDLAEPYMRVLLFSMLPALWFVVLRCFISAFERTRAVLVVTVIGVLANAVANYGLIFGNFGLPRLELVGAAVASATTHALMAVALFVYVLSDRRFRRYAVLGRLWRPDWSRFREIFRIGLPIGSMWVLEVGVFSGAIYLMGLIGTTALAAHQIAMQCASISFMVPLGLAQAATVRVGLAIGAGDLAGARRAGFTAQGLGVGFMLTTCALFLLAGEFLIGLFLDPANPATPPVLALGVTLLAIAGFFQVFDGGQSVAAGALRGLKDTRWPLTIALIAYWGVAFPLGVILGFPLNGGPIGIWLGLVAGLIVAAFLLTWRFHWLTRHPSKLGRVG
jgi:MATE family multidrug resistance protein